MSEFLIPILHHLPTQEQPLTPVAEQVPTFAPIPERDDDAQQVATEKLLAEVEELKQLAYEKAYAEGLEAGKSEATKLASSELQKTLAFLKETEQAFQFQCHQYMEGMDNMISAIVLEAVLKIIGSEIQQPGNRVAIIRQVITQYEHRNMVQILMNPADMKAMKEYLQNTSETTTPLEALFYPDASVSPAGCRIVFKDAVVNTDLKKQLHAFAEHLSDFASLK